jgi:hypothetical protein
MARGDIPPHGANSSCCPAADWSSTPWLSEGGLEEAFPDVVSLAETCPLRACSHTTEKGCVVQRALAENRLAPERFASFQKLRRELDYLASERREHTYLARRREAALRRRRADRAHADGWTPD